MENRNLFQSVAELEGYLFRIIDNGGATADRYTVQFSDGDALTLSAYPSHPQGVSMWAEQVDPAYLGGEVEKGAAVDLGIYDLPESIRLHILARANEAWADCLARLELEGAALGRDGADENEGLAHSGGTGVYRSGSGYFVRIEGPAEDDRGPYSTARKALLASLPDPWSLAGPEYHSPVIGDIQEARDPDPERLAAVAALEARVKAGEVE